MSTGIAVNFWGATIPFQGASGLLDLPASGTAQSSNLLFLADREYQITSIFLRNMSTAAAPATIDVTLALTTGGGSLNVQNALGRRIIPATTLGQGEWLDWTGCIPFFATYGLVGIASQGLADNSVYGAICGRVLD